MTPLDQIAALYARYGGDFPAELFMHFRYGVVISTADLFVMARPCSRANPMEVLERPECADCWFVWAFAGDLRKLLTMIPYPLPWVCWSRRGKALRFWRLESTIAHASRIPLPPDSQPIPGLP